MSNMSSAGPYPTNIDFSTISQRNYQGDHGGYYREGALDSINACYVHGHVQRIFASQIKVRYRRLNAWVCR